MSQEGIEILVSMLTDAESEELGLNDEAAECAAAGISFVNVPIPDRWVPSDANAFLRSVEELATRVFEGHYVTVHCRASIGRSSVLAASTLIRLGWDAKTAFDAIEVARGCSVPDDPGKIFDDGPEWRAQAARISAQSGGAIRSIGAVWAFSVQPVLPSACRPLVLLVES